MPALYKLVIRRQRVVMAREATPTWSTRAMTQPQDAADIVRALNGPGCIREFFYVFCLDIKHKLLGYDLIAQGTLAAVEMVPSEAFRAAVLLGAPAIIVAHNHPSGDPWPSEADHEITKRLHQAGDVLGIMVVDHVVVADNRHYSFTAGGIS